MRLVLVHLGQHHGLLPGFSSSLSCFLSLPVFVTFGNMQPMKPLNTPCLPKNDTLVAGVDEKRG
jgi:hypothetical protein